MIKPSLFLVFAGVAFLTITTSVVCMALITERDAPDYDPYDHSLHDYGHTLVANAQRSEQLLRERELNRGRWQEWQHAWLPVLVTLTLLGYRYRPRILS